MGFFDWLTNAEPHASLDKLEREMFEKLERKAMAEQAAAKLEPVKLGPGKVVLLGKDEVLMQVALPAFRPKRRLAGIIVQARPCACGTAGCMRSVFQVSRFDDLIKFEAATRALPIHVKARFVTIEREIFRILDPSLHAEEQYELFEKLFAAPQVKPAECN
jgi:hypothetical protein